MLSNNSIRQVPINRGFTIETKFYRSQSYEEKKKHSSLIVKNKQTREKISIKKFNLIAFIARSPLFEVAVKTCHVNQNEI